jgi:anthranilate/para-aminobenzoate synthase component I
VSSSLAEQFMAAVERAKETSRAGDIFQVVLSHACAG